MRLFIFLLSEHSLDIGPISYCENRSPTSQTCHPYLCRLKNIRPPTMECLNFGIPNFRTFVFLGNIDFPKYSKFRHANVFDPFGKPLWSVNSRNHKFKLTMELSQFGTVLNDAWRTGWPGGINCQRRRCVVKILSSVLSG